MKPPKRPMWKKLEDNLEEMAPSEQEMFSEVFSRHLKEMVAFARHKGSADPESCAVDAYLKTLAGFDPKGDWEFHKVWKQNVVGVSINNYNSTKARNDREALDQYYSTVAHQESDGHSLPPAWLTDTAHTVLSKIDTIPSDEERQAISLHYFHKLSIKEICSFYRDTITISCVKTRLSRGIQKIKRSVLNAPNKGDKLALKPNMGNPRKE